jgi:hypothetical protein
MLSALRVPFRTFRIWVEIRVVFLLRGGFHGPMVNA